MKKTTLSYNTDFLSNVSTLKKSHFKTLTQQIAFEKALKSTKQFCKEWLTPLAIGAILAIVCYPFAVVLALSF